MTKIELSEILKVEVIPSTTHALLGIKNTLDVLFNIVTQEIPWKGERQPLNLSIVLDRSGSMGSEKRLDNSKKAIIGILEKLTKEDLVHFVTYDTDVQVVFQNVQIDSPGTLKEMTEVVNKVSVGGMTNLGGGLEEGVAAIKRSSQANGPRNSRVFLFSDGRVNVGVTSKPELFGMAEKYLQEGISLTSFGLGKEYDEELMKGLAEKGGGAYYFINKSSSIDRFVSRAIDGLLGLVGTQAKLKVRGKNSGIVTKIWGQEDESLVSGANLGDIKEKNTRQVLVRLEVSPSSGSSSGSVEEVLTYSLEYLALKPEKEKTTESEALSEKENLSGSLKVSLTEDSDLVSGGQNQEVSVMLTIQKAGEEDKLILEELEKGNIEEALRKEEANLAQLRLVQEADRTGQVSNLISNAQATLDQIKKEGNSSRTKKKVHHARYTKLRCSVDYTAGYGEEEEEEEESDEDNNQDQNQNQTGTGRPFRYRRSFDDVALSVSYSDEDDDETPPIDF